MEVTIRLYATLSGYSPDTAHPVIPLNLPCQTTVAQVLDRLQVPHPDVKMIFINGVHATLDTVLANGDRVGLFPAIGGG